MRKVQSIPQASPSTFTPYTADTPPPDRGVPVVARKPTATSQALVPAPSSQQLCVKKDGGSLATRHGGRANFVQDQEVTQRSRTVVVDGRRREAVETTARQLRFTSD